MSQWIPCMCCHEQHLDENWDWYVCDHCGYRICPNCLPKHSGPWNETNGGQKCSQCQKGWLRLQHGYRSLISRKQTSAGIIYTNTAVIAQKYNDTSAQDVRAVIKSFIAESAEKYDFQWECIDLGSEEMQGVIGDDASWTDYAQLLSDYADGVGIKRSAHTPLFIIGGGDVIPMPEFYTNIGHDVKTIEDSDLLYCFPIDYAWKKVSIKDAIFNVSRLPLDYADGEAINSTIEDDLGAYFNRALESLANGIPFTYAMMVSNAGKKGSNDWTWTSADVMAKLPQQQLKNDGELMKDNMFLCPALDVMGEEYDSNANVQAYKKYLEKTDMLFINLHGSHCKEYSGYLGQDGFTPYWGMTTELMKQVTSPIINAFPCYGARYGRYYFDNNEGSVPDYEVYDRDDSMLLTAFYESNVLLFAGSCTSSMCSKVIGQGTIVDHINESNNAVDLLMPAGYAEAMLKLYACYLIQGEPAGYAFLHAKIDYLNYRARYEKMDLVFLTLNQFNLFGCPTLYLAPQEATRQLREAVRTVHVEPKELPESHYRKEFDRTEVGVDGVLSRVRTLVDNNLKELENRIRVQLYDKLGLTEDHLVRIESVEYNGQLTYTMTYSKKNKFYPEFVLVLSDKQGNIKEIVESR